VICSRRTVVSDLFFPTGIFAERWNTVTRLAATVSKEELLGLENGKLLYRLFHEHEVKIFPPRKVQYRCNCSRERTARALFALGEKAVLEFVTERGTVEMGCEFCGRQFVFKESQLRLLFEKPSGSALH
jgi:molecular chaperone Hsp33